MWHPLSRLDIDGYPVALPPVSASDSARCAAKSMSFVPLRNAVINQRDGGQAEPIFQARGTGKTSSARILAKVLNCEAPVDGEPCCVCESCLAVEAGTSFDVHELDAASNQRCRWK